MAVSPAELWRRAIVRKPGATEAALFAAEQAIGISLPVVLREFLKFSDGAEGFVGRPPRDIYRQLNSIAQIVELREDRAFMEQRPDLVPFGGNGGSEGYFLAPSLPGNPVLMIALISDWHADAIECAPNIEAFFDGLHEGTSSWPP